ncbi:MAG: anaerobic C4-dicarboxylate transporter family protein [Thermoanaerobaculales bacterium]|jgi:anaerobic C4-dicarboxylate transporter-like protein|nr:anaerobic C4-dicarboxylate transporter family protein [Thermoanaerobaculales bacterium]
MLLWIELALLLACIVIGARLGGIALGTISGIGLVVFVFGFRMPPGGPPGTVLGMIIAVITALAAMQAAGGLDYLVGTAGRFLEGRPRQITFLAPLVTYLLVFAAGTQHVVYALLPVIAEVSRKAGIRPERPLSASVIAAQAGVIASPIAASTVALAGLLAGVEVGLPQILLVIVPATAVGATLATLSVAFRGADLAGDAEYQRRLAAGTITPPAALPTLEGETRRRAVGSCLVFLAAIVAVVLIGLFPDARPEYSTIVEGITETGQVEMGRAIMIIMLATAGLTMVLFKANPEVAVKGSIMKGGLVALISILGVSWLGSSFFEANQGAIVGGISSAIQSYPWVFAVGLFALSILLFSQAATIVTLVPVGLALGLPASLLVGSYAAVNGTFFLPTYGTVLAAVSFDQTGTTRIGKYLLNHSFMRPGLVNVVASTAVAMVLARWLLG